MEVKKNDVLTYTSLENLSTYNEGYFIIEHDRQHYTCTLVDKEHQWDYLYNYLMVPMDLEVVEVKENGDLVVNIIRRGL